jgi:hypothetical protein
MTPHYAGYSTQISTQATPVPAPLHPTNCSLEICQQPREALLTVKGKEKFRKPIDPPPILQLKVNADADPQSQYLQNPYLFVAVSLYKPDRDEPFEATPANTLAGVLVSSLHRLKSIENKDGGFFVFGDISVKEHGQFRLRFTLFEFKADRQEYVHLTNITSNKFAVVLPKDFRGLEESSYLSRSFSDQGVRLRIRKETRSMASKRSYTDESPSNQNALLAPDVEYQPTKKRREEYIDSPVIPSSAPHINMPSYMPSSIPRQPLPLSNMSYGRLPMGQPLGSSSITFRLKAKDNKLYIDSINNCHSNHYGTHNTFPLHNTPLGKDRQHTTTRTPVGTTLILNLSRFRNGIPGYGVVMGVSMRDVRTAY